MSTTTATTPDAVENFIARWQSSGGAERANYQLFLSELCAVLNVPLRNPTRPDDADNAFSRANLARVRELLVLRLLGQVRQVDADRFAA
jgi:hypothetical protein